MRLSSLLLAFVSGVSVSLAAPKPLGSARSETLKTLISRDTCPAPEDILIDAPKPNPFGALEPEELASVLGWLTDYSALNLTNSSSPDLGLSDNYIAHVEILKPNKTDVLSYLYADGKVPRYARIILNHGAAEVPHVAEYSVSNEDAMLPMAICCSSSLICVAWIFPARSSAD